MELKLRVEAGKNAGQEIRIAGPEFVIGRGDECQLRAGSDMISRRHCMLIVGDSYAGLRDLGSKNGTLVNGEAIQNREVPLHSGDKLRIGPLEFSVLLNAGLTGKKLPAVHNVREAVARVVKSPSSSTDADIAQWLMDGDVGAAKNAAADTKQMRLNDTEEIDLTDAQSGTSTVSTKPSGASAKSPGPDQSSQTDPADTAAASLGAAGEKDDQKRAVFGGPKKLPSKLPTAAPTVAAGNTRQAASDIIDKMRKRR